MKIKEAVETLYSYGVEYEDINEATDTLLTAYEKQQKEIEELKALKREILINRIPCQFFEDYISKDKIKAKIEEIDRKIEFEQNEKVIIYLHKQKRVLQSLLEKE